MTKVQFILYVANQHNSTIFYQNSLAMKPVLNVPGMTEFQLSQECKLGLMPETGIAKILNEKVPHPSTGNGIPRCELYIYVENSEECFVRSVLAGGIPICEPKDYDWGDKVAYIKDLDGHILAFAEKL